MALTPPGSVDFVVTGPYNGYLTWEILGEYRRIWIYEKKGTDDYQFKDDIMGHLTSYPLSGLDANTSYCYMLRALGPPPMDEESDYSDEDCETTNVVLEDPTDIVTTVFANFVEITWKDNSSMEDVFCIERSGTGAFEGEEEEIDTVPRNMEYYRDTTVVKGSNYWYRVRAKNNTGPEYSGYVTGSQVTANNNPNDPTGAVISGVTDEEMRVTWVAPVAGFEVTGYKVQIDDNVEFSTPTEYIVADDVLTFLFKGLTPSQQYWVRVYSYNGAGNSASYSTDNDTCLALYAFTEYEKFIRRKNIDPVYLAEAELKMDLASFTLVSGKTNTWEKTVDERGITIGHVWEDGGDGVTEGEEYAEKASIDEVEATASTFYFDYDNQQIYVHTSNGTNPNNFLIEGGFWKYFSNRKNLVFNGNHYLNLLNAEDIPDISQDIKVVHEGSFALSTGSVAFLNRKIKGEHFFDKRFERYTWEGSKLILKAGEEGFSYSDYEEIFTAFIDRKSCNDLKATFVLRDIRQDLDRDIILDKYSLNEYPDMDDEFDDTEKPKFIGFHDEVTPVRIESYEAAANKSAKFHFNDGRSRSVESVEINELAKTEGAGNDYYVDLQRSIITFSASLEITEDDIITVGFAGYVNSADEIIENGADVFKYALNEFAGIPGSLLNHDFIYETKYANTKPISIPIYKDTSFNEIIKTLEKTVEASILQDNMGRLGIRPRQTAPASNAKVVEDHHEFGDAFGQDRDRDSLYWKVVVSYKEDIYNQDWLFKEAKDDKIKWRYGVEKELPVYCYFHYGTQAQALATSILNILNKGYIEDELPMLLFDSLPGDIIKFSRARFYDENGEASSMNLRILEISKSPSGRKTTVKMEPM